MRPNWIPISEKLPESYQTIIFYDPTLNYGGLIETNFGFMHESGGWENLDGAEAEHVSHWAEMLEGPDD